MWRIGEENGRGNPGVGWDEVAWLPGPQPVALVPCPLKDFTRLHHFSSVGFGVPSLGAIALLASQNDGI